jgi:hypothetical protein
MHVILVEPRFPANQRNFVRALVEAGAQVTAIGEGSKESLDPELRRWLRHYQPVRNVCDVQELLQAVRFIQRHAWVDRLEATVEAHILATAQVREACGIPGTSYRSAWLCRDKPAMKEVLRAGGVPCAASAGVEDVGEALAWAECVGYPLIVKPRDGAGASGATRVDTPAELESALRALRVGHPGRSAAVEEFVEGHEAFYDTLTFQGQVVHDFVCHYYPNVLEAMRTRWISPCFVSTNRLDDAPSYEPVRQMGQKVITLLGLETTATHMEWFIGPRGLRFSEIGCRPPGVRTWDLYNVGNDMDLYREWAMLIVQGRPSQRPSRRLATGILALRPDRDGRIRGLDGWDEVQHHLGHHLIDWHIPASGTPTQPVEAGYMANAWVRMKHPDYDALRRMLDHVARHVKLRAT